MNKVLVTGGTGQLGSLTIQSLLRTTPPGCIATLVRDPMKAAALRQQGVEIRQGDYFDKSALTAACRGVTKLFLVSAVTFADRETQHRNVIEAARIAGVEHIVYTSIQRKPGSAFTMTGVTQTDRATERALLASGLRYTILRNCLYLDLLPLIIGSDALTRGVRVPAGGGAAPLITRADLADANAAVLTQSGHENKIYTLGASAACSFADIAAHLSQVCGRPIPHTPIATATYIAERATAGLGRSGAAFLAEWVQAITLGEFAEVTGDLERLIGRQPIGYRAFLRAAYPHAA
jgi:NAD(P)H dehydrogenase (quinone)